MNAPHVVIAHPDRLVAQALAALCDREGVDVVGIARFGDDAVKLCEQHRDIAVVVSTDLLAADDLLAGRLLATGAALIGLADDDRHYDVLEMLARGASGWVTAESPGSRLPEAIRTVRGGAVAIDPGVATAVVDQWRSMRRSALRPPAAALTEREIEVLTAMIDGLSTKAIARRLGVAPKTVENHKTRVFDKLGARTQAHAVALASAQGLARQGGAPDVR